MDAENILLQFQFQVNPPDNFSRLPEKLYNIPEIPLIVRQIVIASAKYCPPTVPSFG